jgi:hypothetical protein
VRQRTYNLNFPFIVRYLRPSRPYPAEAVDPVVGFSSLYCDARMSYVEFGLYPFPRSHQGRYWTPIILIGGKDVPPFKASIHCDDGVDRIVRPVDNSAWPYIRAL